MVASMAAEQFLIWSGANFHKLSNVHIMGGGGGAKNCPNIYPTWYLIHIMLLSWMFSLNLPIFIYKLENLESRFFCFIWGRGGGGFSHLWRVSASSHKPFWFLINDEFPRFYLYISDLSALLTWRTPLWTTQCTETI